MNDAFTSAVLTIHRGLVRLGRERARLGEVQPTQVDALLVIADYGYPGLNALATLLGIDPSNAYRAVVNLEKLGFLVRGDEVTLTSRGRRAADQARAAVEVSFSALLEKIPRGDRETVVRSFQAIAKALES